MKLWGVFKKLCVVAILNFVLWQSRIGRNYGGIDRYSSIEIFGSPLCHFLSFLSPFRGLLDYTGLM